jgi:hypothetical protein
MWETDATVRAALQESVQASVTALGTGALLSGGELGCDVRAAGPRSLYVAEARASYARALEIAAAGGAGPPADNVDAEGAATATWTPWPRASLALATQASLATSWGMRADSLLLQRDPFLDDQRLEYAFGADLSYALTSTPRRGLGLDGGFAQAGALAAASTAAVGADSREGHGGVSYSLDLGPRTSITPELRYVYTHYEHALLDVDFHRGPADIHGGTLALGGGYELSSRLSVTGSGGVTVASPMPILHTGGPVVAPEIGAGLRWTGQRARLTARYAWAYTSMGPRIGYGQQHTATVKLTAHPFVSAGQRDILLHGLVRASHGAAPLAADPEPTLPGMAPRSLTGTLVATRVAGRAVLEVPILRGVAFTSGIDLAYTHGVVQPAPPGEGPRGELLVSLSLGLAVTASTDRRRLLPHDPEADASEAARRAAAPPEPGDRLEDRTRRSDEGGEDDAVDHGWDETAPEDR